MKKCSGSCTYYRIRDFTQEEVRRKNLVYVEAILKCRNICKHCGHDKNYRMRSNVLSLKKFNKFRSEK